MLIRRLRDECRADDLQVIGTSATMSSEGTLEERAGWWPAWRHASSAPRSAPSTWWERRSCAPPRTSSPTAASAGRCRPRQRHPAAARVRGVHGDPLASWVETTFGLAVEAGHRAGWSAAPPTTVPEAAEAAGRADRARQASCAAALRNVLREGSAVTHPTSKRPVFAFRLHQFLSKGDTVYVSLEPEDTRHITGTYQVRVPGHPDKALLPLGFCRECGQEYLVVARTTVDGESQFVSRRDADASGGDAVTGYLYVSSDYPWPDEATRDQPRPRAVAGHRPRDRPRRGHRQQEEVPARHRCGFALTAAWTPPAPACQAWFVSTPFAFCMRCGVSYEQVRGQDFGKLATLDAEGRSSAVSLLSAVGGPQPQEPAGVAAAAHGAQAAHLRRQPPGRQPAGRPLQRLRPGLPAARRALRRAGEGRARGPDPRRPRRRRHRHARPADGRLRPAPEAKFSAKKDAERALRAAVEYQLYVDLQRGWRVTMPNLEQTGLLKLAYRDLPELAEDEESWEGTYLLDQISAAQRQELCQILLDELRRVRAIAVDCLTEDGFDRLKRLTRAHLIEPWSLGEDDRMVEAGVAIPRPAKAGGRRSVLAVSGRGAFGKYLRRDVAGLPDNASLKSEDSQRVILDLFQVLTRAGLLTQSDGPDGSEYRINAGALRWVAGDGSTGAGDPLRKSFAGEETARVNPFFRELYRDLARGFAGLLAREHTAQVPQEDRLERERQFREGELPLLYCSPTMELGVDISDLNAVALRNVPPTPANYAQRSGRAGRSGQQALVLTYCSTGNAHDSYWFRRSREMVAGSVIAPRLDLTNEDLVRSHVHAIWLAETNESMKSSITSLVDADGDSPGYALFPDLWRAVTEADVARRAQTRAERVLAGLRTTWQLDGGDPVWWSDTWVHDQVARAPQAFDDAFDRWRTLYRTALTEANEQHKLALSTTASRYDRTHRRTTPHRRPQPAAAAAQRRLRGRRHRLLQLPLPGQRGLPARLLVPPAAAGRLHPRPARRQGTTATTSSAPASWRSREFGPNSLIYHEGARYEVTRVQLPRDPGETSGGGAITETAKRCPGCGYHHPVQVGTDMCENCGERARRHPVRAAAAPDGLHPPPRTDQQRRGGAPPLRLRARGLLPVPRPRRGPGLHPRRGDTRRRHRPGAHPRRGRRHADHQRRPPTPQEPRRARLLARPARGPLAERQAGHRHHRRHRRPPRRRGRQGAREGRPLRPGPPQHPHRPRRHAPGRRGRGLPARRARAGHRGRVPARGRRARQPRAARRRRTGPHAAHRGRGRRRRRPAATRRRARRDPAGGPQGAGDHPLRPRHRRRPRARRRRPRPLRARLLRLPALLRQPVRAHPHQPTQRRRDPAQPPRRPRRGRRRRTPPRRPGRLAHQARRLDPGVPLHLLAPLDRPSPPRRRPAHHRGLPRPTRLHLRRQRPGRGLHRRPPPRHRHPAAARPRGRRPDSPTRPGS